MSSFKEMVTNDIGELKLSLKQMYDDSFELHSAMLTKIKSLKNVNKRSWEYATYVYLRSQFYEKKSNYKNLYKLVCDIEQIIQNEILN